MIRILASIVWLLFSTAAIADNYQATQGTGTTFAAKSILGVLYPWWISTNSSGTELWTTTNPGSVVVLNTITVSPTVNTPITGTVAATQSGNWQVGLGTTSTSPIFDSVTNTVSVSPTGNTPIQGSVSVTGTVSTSPTGNTPVTGTVGVTGTVSTSPTGTTPVGIIGTVSISPTGNTPVTGTVNAAQNGNWQVGLGTTSTSPIFGSITNTVSVSPTGNTPVTGTINAAQNGNWQVGLGTTSTSGIWSNIIGTISVSPTGTTPTSPTGTTPVHDAGPVPASQNGNWQIGLGTTNTSGIWSNIIGTISVSPTGTTPVSPTGTTPTSPTGTTPVGVVGTASVSPVGTTPVIGTTGFGIGSIGSAIATSAINEGAQARSSEITAGANGNLIGIVADLVGRLIVSPYTNKENLFTFAISSTTSTPNILVPSFGQGVWPYITSLSCFNTAATSQLVTIVFSPTAATAGVATISPIYRMVLGAGTSSTAFFTASFPTPLGGVSMGSQNSNVNVYMRGTDAGAAFTGLIGCNVTGYKGS